MVSTPHTASSGTFQVPLSDIGIGDVGRVALISGSGTSWVEVQSGAQSIGYTETGPANNQSGFHRVPAAGAACLIHGFNSYLDMVPKIADKVNLQGRFSIS